MAEHSLSLVSSRRSKDAFGGRTQNGKTNGLSRAKHKSPSLLKHRGLFPEAFLTLGVLLYAVSLLWPLASISPGWVAYVFAFLGIAIVIASLRNMWTRTGLATGRP